MEISKIAKSKFLLPFILVLSAFLLFRLATYDRAYAHDDAGWVMAAHNDVGYAAWNFHPPIGITLMSLANTVFGWDHMRLMFIFLSLAAFIATSYYARKWSGDSAALASGLLMAVSYYSIMASQQIDVDGAWLALLNFLALAIFLKWDEQGMKGKRLGLLCGALIGIGVMTRISNAFILVPLGFYMLLQKRDLKNIIWVTLPAILPYAAWILLDDAFFHFNNFAATTAYNGSYLAQLFKTPLLSILRDKAIYVYTMQRKFTPPLVVLSLMAIYFYFQKKRTKFEDALLIFVAATFAVYALPFMGDKPRYASMALPEVFVLLGIYVANSISKQRWREGLMAALCAAYSFAVLYSFNLSEWELMSNFIAFTIAKYVLVLVPLAAVCLLSKPADREKTAIVMLVGFLVGFSAYYTFFGSTETTSSFIVSQLNGKFDGGMLVFGEYGLCHLDFNNQPPCAFLFEYNSTHVLGQNDERFVAKGTTSPYPPAIPIAISNLSGYMHQYGLSYYVVSKKVVVDYLDILPTGCTEYSHLDQYGQRLATIYKC